MIKEVTNAHIIFIIWWIVTWILLFPVGAISLIKLIAWLDIK